MSSELRKAPNRFSETVIDDEVVVMHLDTGVFYSLSGTAAAAWRLIDGSRDREALIAALAAEFGAAADQVESDIAEFLEQLGEAGLVETN